MIEFWILLIQNSRSRGFFMANFPSGFPPVFLGAQIDRWEDPAEVVREIARIIKDSLSMKFVSDFDERCLHILEAVFGLLKSYPRDAFFSYMDVFSAALEAQDVPDRDIRVMKLALYVWYGAWTKQQSPGSGTDSMLICRLQEEFQETSFEGWVPRDFRFCLMADQKIFRDEGQVKKEIYGILCLIFLRNIGENPDILLGHPHFFKDAQFFDALVRNWPGEVRIRLSEEHVEKVGEFLRVPELAFARGRLLIALFSESPLLPFWIEKLEQVDTYTFHDYFQFFACILENFARLGSLDAKEARRMIALSEKSVLVGILREDLTEFLEGNMPVCSFAADQNTSILKTVLSHFLDHILREWEAVFDQYSLADCKRVARVLERCRIDGSFSYLEFFAKEKVFSLAFCHRQKPKTHSFGNLTALFHLLGKTFLIDREWALPFIHVFSNRAHPLSFRENRLELLRDHQISSLHILENLHRADDKNRLSFLSAILRKLKRSLIKTQVRPSYLIELFIELIRRFPQPGEEFSHADLAKVFKLKEVSFSQRLRILKLLQERGCRFDEDIYDPLLKAIPRQQRISSSEALDFLHALMNGTEKLKGIFFLDNMWTLQSVFSTNPLQLKDRN